MLVEEVLQDIEIKAGGLGPDGEFFSLVIEKVKELVVNEIGLLAVLIHDFDQLLAVGHPPLDGVDADGPVLLLLEIGIENEGIQDLILSKPDGCDGEDQGFVQDIEGLDVDHVMDHAVIFLNKTLSPSFLE
jgi:hypothetical protein